MLLQILCDHCNVNQLLRRLNCWLFRITMLQASRHGPAGSTRLNVTAAQVSNPLWSALCCLHEGCPEGKLAVHMLKQCAPLLVEKAGAAQT